MAMWFREILFLRLVDDIAAMPPGDVWRLVAFWRIGRVERWMDEHHPDWRDWIK